jgi:hypothetical protein
MAKIENSMLQHKFVWAVTGGHDRILTWQVGYPCRVPDKMMTWRCSTALVHEEWPTEHYDSYGTSSMKAAVSAISLTYGLLCQYVMQGHSLYLHFDKTTKLTVERLHSKFGIIPGIEPCE